MLVLHSFSFSLEDLQISKVGPHGVHSPHSQPGRRGPSLAQGETDDYFGFGKDLLLLLVFRPVGQEIDFEPFG